MFLGKAATSTGPRAGGNGLGVLRDWARLPLLREWAPCAAGMRGGHGE